MLTLNRIRQRLADDTGSVLIDSMVGVLVAAIAILGLATVTTTVSSAISASVRNTERLTFLRSYANELGATSTNVASGPVSSTQKIGTHDVTVTTWQTVTPGSVVVHAAAPEWVNGTEADCSNVNTVPSNLCLVVEVSVNPGGSGIVTVPLASSLLLPATATSTPTVTAPGPVGTFTPAAGLTELRFVVRVGAATGPGSLTFTDTVSGTVVGTIPFDASSDGYLYGSVAIPGASPLQLDMTGATASLSHLYVYEAPR